MKLGTSTFRNVVNYLSGFGGSESPILFSPLNDGLVMASVNGEDSFGQYLFSPDDRLEYRFAVRIETLKRIASVVTGETMKYRLGSQALFECDGAQWWVPVCDPSSIETRPEIEPEGHIEWGGDFCQWLGLMKHSTQPSDDSGCLDCVYIDVNCHRDEILDSGEAVGKAFRQGRRTMVSTDRRTMSVYQESIDEYDFVGRVLIERRHIPAIINTCESGARVSIRIGLNHFSVECGRRTSVFGRRRGIYPKAWRDAFKSATSSQVVGSIEASRFLLGSAVRQVSVVDDAISMTQVDSGVVMKCARGESKSNVELEAKVRGDFGPVILREEYLSRIASTWPTDDVFIEYRGIGPISVRTPRKRNFIAIFQPISERVENADQPS